MRKIVRTFLMAACLVLAVAACDSRTEQTDSGGVILSTSDFGTLQVRISMNQAVNGPFDANTCTGSVVVCIDSITIDNIAANPNAPTSDLMTVEMKSYEVTYSRGDGGTRLPPPLVQTIFGNAPVGGQQVYNNLPVLSGDQLLNPPLADLLPANGGTDQETGLQVIVLNIRVRFFGRTIGGRDVDSAPVSYTVEFIP